MLTCDSFLLEEERRSERFICSYEAIEAESTSGPYDPLHHCELHCSVCDPSYFIIFLVTDLTTSVLPAPSLPSIRIPFSAVRSIPFHPSDRTSRIEQDPAVESDSDSDQRRVIHLVQTSEDKAAPINLNPRAMGQAMERGQ